MVGQIPAETPLEEVYVYVSDLRGAQRTEALKAVERLRKAKTLGQLDGVLSTVAKDLGEGLNLFFLFVFERGRWGLRGRRMKKIGKGKGFLFLRLEW